MTAAQKDKFPITVEKGIRQVGPRRWEVRVFAGTDPDTGRPRQVTRGTTEGIRAARAIRARLATEVAEGDHGRRPGTFGALLDDWIRNGKQGRAVTTIEGYRMKIDSAIRPALGSVPVDKLTTKDLDQFYADEMRAGRSPATVMAYHRIIRAALRQAEKWGMVKVSAARNAQPPRVPVKAMAIPSPERVRALIDAAAASRTPEMATVITTAALTGMRRGELAGLQWSDIDWPGSALTVRRSIWQKGNGEMGAKDPKTHQVRRLELGEHAMAVLAGRQKRVADAAELAGIEIGADAYVFADDIHGVIPVRPNTMTNRFATLCRAMAEADPDGEPWPYRFHDLRHYAGSEMLRHGISPRTAADRLGHSDPALTLRVYVHDSKDQAIAAAGVLEAGIAG